MYNFRNVSIPKQPSFLYRRPSQRTNHTNSRPHSLTVHIYDIKNKEIPLKWNSHNFNNVQDQTVINDSIDFPTKGGLSYPITIHPLNGGVTAMDFTINAPKPATFQSP